MTSKNQAVFNNQPRDTYMQELMLASVSHLFVAGGSLAVPNAAFSAAIVPLLSWTPDLTVLKKNTTKTYFQEEAEWAWTFLRHIGLFKPRAGNSRWELTPTAADIIRESGFAGIRAVIADNYVQTARLSVKYKAFEADERLRLITDRLEADALDRNPGNQAKFRLDVLKSCNSACVVSGFTELRALHACHIRDAYLHGPYVAANGIVLRADLHCLYDVGLLLIDGTGNISTPVADYSNFNGKSIRMPSANVGAMLQEKYDRFA